MRCHPVLRIEYVSADGKTAEREIPVEEGNASDGRTEFSLTERGGIFAPRLVSAFPDRLRYVKLFFPFTDPDAEKICYADAYITNECTKTDRLSASGSVRSGSLVLAKAWEDGNSEKTCGIGFVTSVRFFSWLVLDRRGITVAYYMEDRELVPGENYDLEKFMICSEEPAEAFLERLSSAIRLENGAREPAEIPVGFCSWSRYYGEVNEEKILYNAEQMHKHLPEYANLVQIDDGWQLSGSFCGDWQPDPVKFPHGMGYISDAVHSLGMRFGLWLAPFMLAEESAAYDRLRGMARQDHRFIEGIYAFELDDPEYLEYLYALFRRIKEEYRCDYIKLDFLFGAIGNHGETAEGIFTYKSDYCMAVFRRALSTIRRAVGEDTVLLSCGAPMLATAGICDCRRVACDIIWGKKKEYPSSWTIMQDAAGTVFHRYFYNGSGAMNDADGIVVRDHDVGDGFDCTYSEARLWATAVAMSGGVTLVNEELDDLSPARRDLFLKQLPPLGATGRPVEFFENRPSAVAAEPVPGTCFIALFHYGDEYGEMSFPVSKIGFEGPAMIFDCWEGRYLGEADVIDTGLMLPHSASLYMVRKAPAEPSFLYSTGNVFLGQNLHGSRWTGDRLEISGRDDGKEDIFAFFPDGYEVPEGDAVRTAEGTVVKLAARRRTGKSFDKRE